MDNTKEKTAVVWLKVTDYIHDWLNQEWSGAAEISGHHIICVREMEGWREVMRMEATEDMDLEPVRNCNAMSATRYSCMDAGLKIDTGTVKQLYGIDRSELALFMPIECPRMYMTRGGVLRRWTNDVTLGHKQANALQQLIREEFFRALGVFNDDYAMRHGEKYPAIDMIESFCAETGTNDRYAQTIRREWQRRRKQKR